MGWNTGNQTGIKPEDTSRPRVFVDVLIACIDSNYSIQHDQLGTAGGFLIVPFPLRPQLCSTLSRIPLVSTSKYRPRICLGGTLLAVVVKEKTGVFAVIVNACVQTKLKKRDREA